MKVATVVESNTSVRNSTVPPIPAGCPSSVNRSAIETVKSIRAVWVSADNGVTCRSPSAVALGGSLFCQANTTCTKGWWANERVGLSRSTRTSNGTSWFSKASRLRRRTCARTSATVGSPPRSTRSTRVLTKNPTRSFRAGSERPAIGNPTATSALPPSLPRSIANAACTTMKPVAPL